MDRKLSYMMWLSLMPDSVFSSDGKEQLNTGCWFSGDDGATSVGVRVQEEAKSRGWTGEVIRPLSWGKQSNHGSFTYAVLLAEAFMNQYVAPDGYAFKRDEYPVENAPTGDWGLYDADRG
jgi:hypothetical protein